MTTLALENVDVRDLVNPERYAAGRPHDVWAALRHHSPVHWCELDGFAPFWAVTRHADVRHISTHPDLFSSAGRLIVNPVAMDVSPGMAGMTTVLNADPPDHRDWRNMAGPYFRPRPLQQLEHRVREISRVLLDQHGGADGQPTTLDFATDIASWHPLKMIAELLGAHEGDEPTILRIANEIFGNEDPEFAVDRGALFTEAFAFIGRLVAEKRAAPTDDLASVLAHATLHGEPITDIGLVGYLLILITAGHDTTRHSLTTGLAALMDHPDQLQLLRDRSELCASATEEIVRTATPVMQFMRTATQDVEVGGNAVAKGDAMCLYYPSANVDEDVFHDPFAFRIDRDPNPHLAFGVGEHYCLGAALARMEIRVMLEELIPRLDAIEPAGEREIQASTFVSGIKHLPVRWRLRPAA
ncbi:MAG: cytochrome P450 [Acidimicrobiales bacterium]